MPPQISESARLAKAVANEVLGAGTVGGHAVMLDQGSDGEPIVRITLFVPGERVGDLTGDRLLDATLAIKGRLRDIGEERSPLIRYVRFGEGPVPDDD